MRWPGVPPLAEVVALVAVIFGAACVWFAHDLELAWPAATGAAVSLGLLPALGYRSGRWRALAWALLIPLAALVMDVLLLAGITLRADYDPIIWTPIVLFYLPLPLVLIALGVAARIGLQRRRSKLA